jgi:hypothetical protein
VPRIARALALILLVAPSLFAQARPADKTVWPDEGPRKWAPRPTTSAITANDLRTRLYQLADDSMSGRRVGELGNWKGTTYIAAEFKRLGLKPAGDSGTFFQTLPYGFNGFDSLTSRLVAGGVTLNARRDWIPLTASAAVGFGGRIDVTDVPTVYVGRWSDSTAIDANLIRGKIVVFSGAPGGGAGGRGGAGGAGPLSCADVPDRFGARMAAYTDSVIAAGRGGRAGGAGGGGGRGGRGNAAGDPRLAGAVGVLFVALETATPAAISGAFNGARGMQPASAPVGPGGATISAAAAGRIFGRPVDQLTPGTTGANVTAKWSYDWRPTPHPARNVVAILPGSDPALASEYVLVGAHNDHVGTNPAGVDHDSLRAVNWVTRRQGSNDPACRPTPDQQLKIDSIIKRARSIRPPRRDSIMNGADDDGSGTVVMLEIAERFAGQKPARSIIFVSHQAEEGGLLGSRWFVDHPTIPLDKVVAAHNMDMVGKGRVEYVKFGGPTSVQTLGSRRQSREFGDIIDSVNAQRAETMAIDKSWDVFENPMNRFCRSDQVNYVRKGVPVTYFSTGYSPDYHQATDEPQYIEYDHSARIGRFLYDIMWALAVRKDRPAIAGADPRYPSCGG